jgi:hypothetical protein
MWLPPLGLTLVIWQPASSCSTERVDSPTVHLRRGMCRVFTVDPLRPSDPGIRRTLSRAHLADHATARRPDPLPYASCPPTEGTEASRTTPPADARRHPMPPSGFGHHALRHSTSLHVSGPVPPATADCDEHRKRGKGECRRLRNHTVDQLVVDVVDVRRNAALCEEVGPEHVLVGGERIDQYRHVTE